MLLFSKNCGVEEPVTPRHSKGTTPLGVTSHFFYCWRSKIPSTFSKMCLQSFYAEIYVSLYTLLVAPTDPAVFTNDPKEPKTTDEPEITNEPKTTSEPETTNEPTTTKQPTTQARERTTSEPKTFPPGCEDQFCLKCLDGYFRLLIFGDGLKCVKKCPPGYFNFSNDCICKWNCCI